MRIVALLCVAFAAACQTLPPPSSSNSEIIDTTIAAVLANPDAFHDATIRVKGTLNICVSFDCKLCEGIGETQCLNSSVLDPLTGDPTDANWRAHYRLEALYRFTKVTVVGRFNASCLTGKSYEPPPRGTTEFVVCSDRATVFTVDRVEKVHERFPATRFRSSYYLTDTLVAAPDAEADEVVAAYVAALPVSRADKLDPHKVFRVKWDRDSDRSARDELCFCLDKDCAGRWPSKLAHTLSTPNNPYSCVSAENVNRVWRVPLQ